MAAYALAVYRLYGESGPQHRKTMVHVLDLLGCVARGATTEAAIEATPEAIREYLRFLRRHCEPGAPDPRTAFETSIAVHVIEGARLGEGDPDGGFAPDFEPLTRAEHAMYVRRLRWMQDDLVASLRGLPDAELRAKPDAGRPLVQILGHLGGGRSTATSSRRSASPPASPPPSALSRTVPTRSMRSRRAPRSLARASMRSRTPS